MRKLHKKAKKPNKGATRRYTVVREHIRRKPKIKGERRAQNPKKQYQYTSKRRRKKPVINKKLLNKILMAIKTAKQVTFTQKEKAVLESAEIFVIFLKYISYDGILDVQGLISEFGEAYLIEYLKI